MRLRSFQLIVSTIFVIFLLTAAFAQPELDISFNGTGTATANLLGFEDHGYGVAVQPDNKIVVAGKYKLENSATTHFGLVRYNEDGTLDTTYGNGGRVMTVFDPNGIYEGANAIAMQPDGKVLAAGFVSLQPPGPGYFAIARYNTDGTLDATFGAGGKTSAAVVNHINELRAITVAPDGQIAASGFYFGGLQTFEGAALKFNSNGFNLGISTYTTGFNIGDTNYPNSVAIQPDGKIVTGGTFYTSTAPNNQNDIVFIRFKADGTRDTSFGLGGAGRLVISGPLYESIFAIKLLPDGKIMAAGTSDGKFLLMRITSNGFVDSSFNGNGRVTTTFTGDDYANSLFIRPDGKMIVSGYANGAYAVAVYNADGSLDTNFSGDGKLTFGSCRAAANSLAIDSLGRIVLGGDGGNNLAAARLYTLDPIPVGVTGRILQPNGQPVKNLSVGITNQAGETRWTLTSPFGYYQFAGIPTGQTYTVSVSSKRYNADAKTIGLNEEVAGLDFIAQPRADERPASGLRNLNEAIGKF